MASHPNWLWNSHDCFLGVVSVFKIKSLEEVLLYFLTTMSHVAQTGIQFHIPGLVLNTWFSVLPGLGEDINVCKRTEEHCQGIQSTFYYLNCSSWSSRYTLELLFFSSLLSFEDNLFMNLFKKLAFCTFFQISYFFKFYPVLKRNWCKGLCSLMFKLLLLCLHYNPFKS